MFYFAEKKEKMLVLQLQNVSSFSCRKKTTPWRRTPAKAGEISGKSPKPLAE